MGLRRLENRQKMFFLLCPNAVMRSVHRACTADPEVRGQLPRLVEHVKFWRCARRLLLAIMIVRSTSLTCWRKAALQPFPFHALYMVVRYARRGSTTPSLCGGLFCWARSPGAADCSCRSTRVSGRVCHATIGGMPYYRALCQCSPCFCDSYINIKSSKY